MKVCNFASVHISEKISPPWSPVNYFQQYPSFSKRLPNSFVHYLHKRSPGTFGDLLRSVMPFHRPSSIRQGRHLRQNSLSSANSPTPTPVQLSGSGCYKRYCLKLLHYFIACYISILDT